MPRRLLHGGYQGGPKESRGENKTPPITHIFGKSNCSSGAMRLRDPPQTSNYWLLGHVINDADLFTTNKDANKRTGCGRGGGCLK